MRNYVLDTTLLPKVWITWESKKGGHFDKRNWLNCQTGKKKNTPEPWMYYTREGDLYRYHRDVPDGQIVFGINYSTRDADKIWVAAGSNVRYAYAKYHADIDRLEVAAVGISTKRSEGSRKWHFLGDRFFIGKDKSIINQNGQSVTAHLYLYKDHTAYTPKEFVSMLLRLNTNQNFINEFKRFIGGNCFIIGNGTNVSIEYPWHFMKWFTTSRKVIGKGTQHQLVEELTAIELTDASDFAKKYPIKNVDNAYGYYEIPGIVYFEKVNDEWDVLRAFGRTYTHSIYEKWRVYIDKKDRTRIVSKGSDGWIPSRQEHSYYRYNIVNMDEAIANCNRIKYILTSTDKIDERRTVEFLVTALRFPEIEQIVKLGFATSISGIVTSHTPKADLKDLFGGYYVEKEKNILRKVGMTKYQFDKYMSMADYYKRNALSQMRDFFGNDLSHLDNNSFDKYFNAFGSMSREFWSRRSFAQRLQIDEKRFIKNMVRLYDKNSNVFGILNDTVNAYSYLNAASRPEIDWYFDDVSDLVRAHDALTELRRIEEAERRAMWDLKEAERRKKEDEKREKVDKERKQYEYEDDKYIIRLPKDLNEIIREGNIQHICIGGYTSRHAMGQTNLFFLREKSNPDVPFYAIEMNTYKSIVQIHGSCNKWLGNNPEAIPTVIRWLRKNGISCSDKILTCKAKGYGSVNDYVPMPVVD